MTSSILRTTTLAAALFASTFAFAQTEAPAGGAATTDAAAQTQTVERDEGGFDLGWLGLLGLLGLAGLRRNKHDTTVRTTTTGAPRV